MSKYQDDAEYLADMTKQLAEVAERNGLKFGAYLLRLAHLEFKERTEQKKLRDGRPL